MKKVQTSLKSFFKSDESSESSDYSPSPERQGRRPQEYWTRVTDTGKRENVRVTVFDIMEDLRKDRTLQQVRTNAAREPSSMLFDPDAWKNQSNSLLVENYRLTKDQLRSYARVATGIRARLKKVADEFAKEEKGEQEDEESKDIQMDSLLQRQYSPKKKHRISNDMLDGHESNTPLAGRKRQHLSKIDAGTRQRIAHIARARLRTHKELGELFNVTTSSVSQISSAFKRQKKTIEKRRATERRRAQNQEMVDSVVGKLIAAGRSIWSVRQIQSLILKQHKKLLKPPIIRDLLRQKYDLRYKKVKRIPFAGNTERSKVLRSLYAQKMLSILQTKKRIINIDESWIPVSDFRHKRWRKRGMLNTTADKVLSQKVNIISAMASDGEVWLALTTLNTDTEVMKLFMTHLANALTKERANWREQTVFVLDGVSQSCTNIHCPLSQASYHKSEQMRRCYDQLKLQVVLSAPYSYASAPIELWFSRLKQGDLNPQNMATGKRSFKQVASLVYAQSGKIRRSTCVKCFRHTVEFLYRYLVFDPL